ncbi:hypothetical protein DM860_000492 [Cuscuta australis]|uniref:Uncharacterized protein n=1 Tax=Cuscuta australis TaxID=267555 RepID=A0A328CZG5_9ASTE|nr:hypothetical protein DM860_000492 [Cuscuta australis]
MHMRSLMRTIEADRNALLGYSFTKGKCSGWCCFAQGVFRKSSRATRSIQTIMQHKTVCQDIAHLVSLHLLNMWPIIPHIARSTPTFLRDCRKKSCPTPQVQYFSPSNLYIKSSLVVEISLLEFVPPVNGVQKQTLGGRKNSLHSHSSSDEEFEGTIVQADFEFFDPKPDDFHGVKLLLQTCLDNKQWDLSGFVNLILGQPTVGTVIKIAEDEDEGIYSVISAINL